jgi:1-acyl-sn-glycerol-3-phosphate acyltransferase
MKDASSVAGQRLPALDAVNHEPGEAAIRRTIRLISALITPLTRRDWRNQDKIPKTGGIVVVANHISNFDPLALGQFLAFSGRWPRYLAKDSLFGVPVVGRVLRACGQIPVQRNSRSAASALTHAVSAVEAGRAVVVYPEGTITADPDLWPMAGKTGAARIAFATGCPVIPVGQWGAQDIMYGKHAGVPRLLPRKTLRLVAGDPVALDDLRAQPVTSAALNRATERMMAAITALVEEARGERRPAAAVPPADAGTPL